MNKVIAIKFSNQCPLFRGWIEHFSDVPFGRKVLFSEINGKFAFSFLKFGTNHQGGIGATLAAEIPKDWIEDCLILN